MIYKGSFKEQIAIVQRVEERVVAGYDTGGAVNWALLLDGPLSLRSATHSNGRRGSSTARPLARLSGVFTVRRVRATHPIGFSA